MMKVFKFRLEQVLKYRKLLEEKLRSELASIDDAIRSRNEYIQLYQGEKISNRGEFQNRQTRGLKGWEAEIFSLFSRRLEGEISDLCRAREELRASRSERQKDLQFASCNRKIMEKLRDKALSRFKSRILREEQKLIDEAATRNFQRRKRP